MFRFLFDYLTDFIYLIPISLDPDFSFFINALFNNFAICMSIYILIFMGVVRLTKYLISILQ